MTDGKGYIVPDPIDPGSLRCFKVYVPAHVQYLGAFWAAYEFFTTWIAWARDPLHKGKIAAAVWRRAYDRAREEYLTGKGCEMDVTAIRQNPLNPCDLQASYDGGQSWVTVADLSKCGGGGGSSGSALRFNGTTIQQFDACAQAWVDIGPSTSPAFAGAVAGAWVGNNNGGCLAAANMAEAVQYGKAKMCTVVGSSASFGQVALTAFDTLATVIPGLQVFEPATVFLDIAYLYLVDHYLDVSAVALDDELPVIVATYFNDDGTITQTNFDRMLVRLQQKIDSYSNPSAERTAWGYAWAWINCAGPSGLVRFNKYANITTYDCSAAEWEAVLDFTASKNAFVVPPKGTGSEAGGSWLSGSGWRTSLIHAEIIGGTRGATRLDLTRVLTDTHLTYAKLEYTIDELGEDIGARYILLRTHQYPDGVNILYEEPNSTGDHTLAADISADVTELWVNFEIGLHADDTDPGGLAWIKRLTLRGTGANPF